jgi:PAS domain S-box-containing protein
MSTRDYQNNLFQESSLFSEKGEMATLISGTDSSNLVGTVDQWPANLRSAIAIILQSHHPMFLLWGRELICFYNDAFHNNLGKNLENEIFGKPLNKAFSELWQIIKPQVESVIKGEGIRFNENLGVPLIFDGKKEVAFYNFTFSPVLDESSKISGVFASCRKVEDFSKKKLPLKQIESNPESKDAIAEERLRMAVEASEMAIWEIELKTDDIKFSTKLPQIFGYSPSQQITLDEIRKHIYPSDRSGVVKKAFDTALQTGNFTFDTRIVKESNDLAHVRVIGKVFYDKNRNPLKIYGTLRDITQEAENRRALEKSERRLRRLVMNAPVAIGILIGDDYVVEMMNDSALVLMGKTKEEIVNKPVLEAMKELDISSAKLLLDSVYYTGKPFSASEYPVKLKRDGVLKKIYINFDYHPLINSHRKVYGIMVVGIDITEQVIARQKVEQSEARFRLLGDSLPLFVWSSDGRGNLNYFNQAVFDYSGLSNEQIQNGGWINIVHPDERNQNLRAWKKAINTGKDFIFEHRFRRFDGVYRWQLSRAIPLRDKQGKIQLWIGSSTDIQDMKNQEQQKDFFISMASHELKTPITSIKGYVQILQSMYEESEDATLVKSLGRIHLQIEKLTKLIGDMLDVSKIRSGNLSFQKQVFDMNLLIREVVEEIEMAHPENKIVLRCDKQLLVFADRERISQVLINLITNAVKYSVKKGDIIITSNVVQKNVMVSVKDEGIGIDRNYQEKIFERFYRVEGKSEKTFPGFGIGLFIAAEIIKSHKGNIGVESEPGKGSLFHFSLPLTKREFAPF